MKKVIIIILLFQSMPHFAQNNCPAGYTAREVKCNGQITIQCVPDDYKCESCWVVEYPPCPGRTFPQKSTYKTYERALAESQKPSHNWQSDGSCLWWDDRSFKIYFEDKQFCSSNPATPSEDFKSKISSLYDSWTLTIADAQARYNGYTGLGLPELTQVSTEYIGNIQEAARNLKKFKQFINEFTGNKTAEIEEQFKGFQNEYSNFQSSSNNYQTQAQALINSNQPTSGTFDGGTWKKLPTGMYEVVTGGDQAEIISATDFTKRFSGNNAKTKINNTDTEGIKALQDLYNQLQAMVKQLKSVDPSTDTKEMDAQLQELKKQIDELKKGN